MTDHNSEIQTQTDSQTQTVNPSTISGQSHSWESITWYLEDSEKIPKFPSDAEKPETHCFLFRGRTNLLTKFRPEAQAKANVDEIRQEIRALAARWLKMQNLCILIGAGASKYITNFVASGLFDRAKKILEKRESSSYLTSILNLASTQDRIGTRFEQFLSELSIFVRLSDSSAWPLDKWDFDFPIHKVRGAKRRKQALKDLLLDIERAVAVVCNVTLPQSVLVLSDQALTAHETFLAKLVERDPQCGRGKIFTTNYDTLIEQAMDRLGIYYCDGFSGTIQRRFNPSGYDLDFHFPGETTEGRVQRYDKVLQLFKLHGSVNWRRTPGTAQNPYGIVYSNKPMPTEKQVLADVSGKRNILSDTFEMGESLEILPTASKYGESLGMPYAHMFRSMGSALREPQTVLFIIGYSGWDAHVNQLIEDALTNPGFTCVVIDPAPSEWARRLTSCDYCGRIYCFGGVWGTFEFFANNVLPDIEVLKTDLAIAKTIKELDKKKTTIL